MKTASKVINLILALLGAVYVMYGLFKSDIPLMIVGGIAFIAAILLEILNKPADISIPISDFGTLGTDFDDQENLFDFLFGDNDPCHGDDPKTAGCSNGDSGLSFKDMFSTFVAGTPIKRKAWGGYWRYHYGIVEMHSRNGSVTNFTDTNDILFTLSGILEDDWEVATDQNSPVMAEERAAAEKKRNAAAQMEPIKTGLDYGKLQNGIKTMYDKAEEDADERTDRFLTALGKTAAKEKQFDEIIETITRLIHSKQPIGVSTIITYNYLRGELQTPIPIKTSADKNR